MAKLRPYLRGFTEVFHCHKRFIYGCGSAEGPTKNGLSSKVRKRARPFCIIRRCARERRNRNQNQFSYVGCKVTAAFMPIYLCFGRQPSQSESRRSATCHNKRRNAHHHKRAMASPRYSTRARVRDCAPTNNTHPTTQRRRRRRRRRARHRRFRPITAGRSSCRGFMVAWRECVRSTDERGSWLCVCVAEKPR